MIRKLMMFFRINKELETQVTLSQQTINVLQGEINTLKNWNLSLQNERKELQDIIYRRFGLTKEIIPVDTSTLEPVRKSKNWADIRNVLERAHQKAPELTEQEQHWKDKMKKDIEKTQ